MKKRRGSGKGKKEVREKRKEEQEGWKEGRCEISHLPHLNQRVTTRQPLQ